MSKTLSWISTFYTNECGLPKICANIRSLQTSERFKALRYVTTEDLAHAFHLTVFKPVSQEALKSSIYVIHWHHLICKGSLLLGGW